MQDYCTRCGAELDDEKSYFSLLECVIIPETHEIVCPLCLQEEWEHEEKD
jgi:hypothetical protein